MCDVKGGDVTAATLVALRGRPTTRQALLDAVDELTAERGWSACSLQAVARRAGLTTGAVYSTFGSRAALLVAAMLRRTEGMAGLPADDPDLPSAVASYARSYWAATRDEQGRNLLTAQLDLLRVAAAEPELGEALARAHTELLEAMAGQLAGRGVPGDTLVLVRRMIASLQGLALQQFAFGSDIPAEEFVAAAQTAVGVTSARRRRRT